MSETLVKLAQLQPVTVKLTHKPTALKRFPLRSTARLFAIADVVIPKQSAKILNFPHRLWLAR